MREYKTVLVSTKQIKDRTVTGLAAIFGNVDSGADRIHPGAFAKTIQERGPGGSGRVKHLWQHDMSMPPTAVVTDLKEVGKSDLPADLQGHDEVWGGLLVARQYLASQFADEVLEGIKAGAITEMSFAYDAVKVDFEENEDTGDMVRNLREVRLWETSDVNWGMNELTVASKSVQPWRDTGVMAEGAPWEPPKLVDFTDNTWADLSLDERSRVAAHYAYSKTNPPALFEDLCLPHHTPSTTGIGAVSWKGTTAAMSALLSVASFILTDTEREAVYEHLAKHYGQFKHEAPALVWFDWIKLTQDVIIHEQIKRVLGESDMTRLTEMTQKINRMLKRAEPPDHDPALTQNILTRLSIAEHSKLRE